MTRRQRRRKPHQVHPSRKCFSHFSRRLGERVEPSLDAKVIWDGIIDAIERGDTLYVAFIARLNKKGRRLWRVGGGPCAYTFFIVYDHALNCPVTVLDTTKVAGCHPDLRRGKVITLEDHI
ncbi:MAG: hypothetical protein ABJG14_21930 [Sulfitobacter sp.]|uniref:hypothetical protein n=1 Tax=Alphaproteobacteria TaxID=28211 RepID=UPI0032666035